MREGTARHLILLLALTIAAMAIQGYHPGLEDDSFYLAAIRKNLNPALFPHDADFFQLQFQATIFDKLVAWSSRLTHLPLPWIILLWQITAVFLILWCCWEISAKCFPQSPARWAAVALVAALLTIPVSGIGITIVDQYLHPRALASALILAAVIAVMDNRRLLAALLLFLAAAMHIIMAAFGISFCLFLGWKSSRRNVTAAVAAIPMLWIFDPASPAWRQAAATRTFYFISRWEWYEWLGVIAPMLLLWAFHVIAKRSASRTMEWFTQRLLWFALFQFAAALLIMLPSSLERLRPLEPMRYLHLIYILMFLMGGGLIGKYILKTHAYRWILFFAPLCFGMWFTQRQMYPATNHLELPGTFPTNDWVRSFIWIRNNTPIESLFALDPSYMELPGEDFHGFRALAERGSLVDNLKDPGMAARVPRLANRWQAEVNAQQNWKHFQAADFQTLKQKFGVTWIVLTRPGIQGLTCPYSNAAVLVCRI